MTTRSIPTLDSDGTARSASKRLRWLPAVAAALVFVAFAFLQYAGRRYRTDELLMAWGVVPFPTPFLDADTVMSALRCVRQGIDVFETNPCDPLGRVYDYSPLWLHAAVFPFTTAWVVPIGLAVDGLFIAALLLLPAVRTWWQAGVVVAAVLSPPVAFAVERANNDLIIFVLAAIAATLGVRSMPFRLLGLASAFLAGLLKYYPMMLMALALRERLRWFIGITIISIGLFVFFVWVEYGPLMRALSLIPTGSYFGDMFGARTLSSGLVEQLHLPSSLGRAGEVVCDILAVAIGARLALDARLSDDLGRLSAHALSFLLAGALLIIACFTTAQNIGYRALHLILIVPAFIMLAGGGPRRRFWALNSAVVIVLLWAEGWRHWLASGFSSDSVNSAAWALREVCWWWVVTILWGTLFTIAARSRAVLEAAAILAGRRRWPARE